MSSIGTVLGLRSELGMMDVPIIPTLGKWRWENQEFKTGFSYIADLKPA